MPVVKTAPAILAMIAFTVLAAAVLTIMPLLVGALIERGGFTAGQAGLIAAMDMLGATLSAAGVSFLVSSGRWRRLLLIAVLVLATANALSALTLSLYPLILLRLAGGFGEGVLLAVASAAIGETRNPDRVFGFATAAQLGFGAVILFLIPSLLAAYSLRGLFLMLAALTVVSGLLVRPMPDRPRLAADSIRAGRFSRQSLIGLTGMLTYYMAQGGAWAYLDRLGVANRLAATDIATALAVSSIAGILGAALSAVLATRYGRIKPLVLSAFCTIASLWVLDHDVSFGVYALAASLFNGAWNFSAPYLFGTLAEIDLSRRTVALAGSAAFAGLTVGPMAAALTLQRDSFANIIWMGSGLCAVSILLFIRVLRPIERLRGT